MAVVLTILSYQNMKILVQYRYRAIVTMTILYQVIKTLPVQERRRAGLSHSLQNRCVHDCVNDSSSARPEPGSRR